MEQINRAMKESRLYEGKLTAKEFACNARSTARRIRKLSGESFAIGTPSRALR